MVGDIYNRHFWKVLATAPAWFGHGGPDGGKATVSVLLPRLGIVQPLNQALILRWGIPLGENCSGDVQVCSLQQESALLLHADMANAGSPLPLLLALPAAGGFQHVGNEELCSFPEG